MSNLTDSQEKIVAAIGAEIATAKREVLEVGEKIMSEISSLRQEQHDRHEAGIHQAVSEQQIRIAELKRNARRIVGNLLKLFGDDD